ncbi:MAG: hypothetical protein JSS01_12385 [Proteobacteria bacterium]|nr:hypothetical protein [Pseudomonadota bacterium]
MDMLRRRIGSAGFGVKKIHLAAQLGRNCRNPVANGARIDDANRSKCHIHGQII